MNTDIDEIKETIRIEAEKQNKYLHRWQTNHGGFAKTISYAIVSDKEKPIKSPNYTSDLSFSVSSEGTTKNCLLYRKFQTMLKALEVTK